MSYMQWTTPVMRCRPTTCYNQSRACTGGYKPEAVPICTAEYRSTVLCMTAGAALDHEACMLVLHPSTDPARTHTQGFFSTPIPVPLRAGLGGVTQGVTLIWAAHPQMQGSARANPYRYAVPRLAPSPLSQV